MLRNFRFLALVLAGLLAIAAPSSAANNEAVGSAIEQFVTSGQLNLNNADDKRMFDLFTFYSERSFKPVWTRDTGVKGKGKALLKALKSAAEHGLDPKNYDPEAIQSRMSSTNPEVLAELDFLMSLSFADFASDLNKGRINPRSVNRELHIKPHGPGQLTLIDGAEQADDLAPYIKTFADANPRYARLKKALADYRAVEAAGGWPKIDEGPTLKPGMTDARIPTLRRYLAITGDLASNDAPDSEDYDEAVIAAVKSFQKRHGEDIDGVLGPGTRKAMNVSVSHRIKQIVINLERRRWMKDELGKRYVFVNLADQFLKVVDTLPTREKTVHTARVVVGKSYHRTPVFSDQMEYIVINPYWNVPSSIANKEYLPKLKRDPGYLARQNIRIIATSGEVNPYSVDWSTMSRMPYRLRQDTGGRNALGRLKFIFPNRHNVYIHDTPSKSLFSRSSRYFSHGCVRVQHPVDLADVLLKPQGWSKAKVQARIRGGKRQIVRLKNKIPVHITYLTAWANKDGSVHFRKDIYGRDKRLMKAMLGKSGS